MAKHVLQNAAVLEVIELLERIDAADHRHALEAAVGRDDLRDEPLARLDYIAATDTEHLEPLDDMSGRATLISLAVYFGKTRLIDNVILHDEKFKPKAGIKLG